MYLWIWRQPLTLSLTDICSVLYTPTAHQSHWLDMKRQSLLDGIPCRKNSFWNLLHFITWHQVWSGLQFRTWLTNKYVSFTSNWPNGMVRRRALNLSAFTTGHVQQRQLQKKKQRTKSFRLQWEHNCHRYFSITKWNFTFAGSCKSAKGISSFFSKALEFSVLEIINTITGTNVVCSIWSLWSIFQVFHCFSLCMPACLYIRLSTTVTTDNSSSINAEEQTNWIKLLTHLQPNLYLEIGREGKTVSVLL